MVYLTYYHDQWLYRMGGLPGFLYDGALQQVHSKPYAVYNGLSWPKECTHHGQPLNSSLGGAARDMCSTWCGVVISTRILARHEPN
jgi:hypothetical protein